jgi:trimethylamine---corrinoid protein Co-methyltransferase
MSRFKVLGKKEIEKIHQGSMHVLRNLGVTIDDPEMKERLHGRGCTINGSRVEFSEDLIEEMLNNVKGEIAFRDRSGSTKMAKSGKVLTHSSGGIPFMIDPETGLKRDATVHDAVNATRLMNKLDHLDMPCALVYPADVPPQISQVRQCELLLRYSEKPVTGPGVSSPGEAKYIVELFRAVSGSGVSLSENPIGDMGISPQSPLYFPQKIVDTMKIIVSAGIPTVMLAAPIIGISAPMTIAGGLVQMNASMLAFAAMAYLINPDTPLIYGARLAFANMVTGSSIWGLPDTGMASACAVQMAGYYGFLSDVYGFSTTACTSDIQAGYEKTMNGILPLLAGANILSGFGGLSSLLVASYEQLVIDNEIASALKRIARGVTVDSDTLALDVIADVVGGGNYLEQDHTVRHLRGGEIFVPEIGFDGLWNEWESGGQKTMRENAREYVLTMLEQDDFEPLPPRLDNEIAAIVDAAYEELVENGL